MRDYNRWTPDEIAFFRELRKQKTPTKAIARRLHRTLGSVQGRINREKAGLKPHSQQPALIRSLLESPKTLAEILALDFTHSPLQKLVTRGHVVGRTFPGNGKQRTYEVTNEGKRNLDSRYPNPCGPAANRPR